MMHQEIGERIVQKFCDELDEIAMAESPPKMLGRMLSVVLAPGAKKKKEAPKTAQQGENTPPAGTTPPSQ
jgi:translation initiation factor IF-3